MVIIRYITDLIGDALSVPNPYIYIILGMPINPIIYITLSYKILTMHYALKIITSERYALSAALRKRQADDIVIWTFTTARPLTACFSSPRLNPTSIGCRLITASPCRGRAVTFKESNNTSVSFGVSLPTFQSHSC